MPVCCDECVFALFGSARKSTVFAVAVEAMKTLVLIPLILLAAVSPPGGTLVIHEWGTFTCLQDEAGQAIGGINTDDEPAPDFVHDLSRLLLIESRKELPPQFFKGAPSCHPDVTMRLETPVIYFHPPKSQRAPRTVDVDVRFRGGWLTQFYPEPNTAVAPGVKTWPRFGHLDGGTVGVLYWRALKVGTDAI